VCNDANDSITLTGVWRLHNQVYPYTKTNWMDVVKVFPSEVERLEVTKGMTKEEIESYYKQLPINSDL